MDPGKLPTFDYPSNQLIEEKSYLSVTMWKKLCIFSTVLELCSTRINPERRSFTSFVDLAKQCNAVMEKYAKMIINHYKDLIPVGLTVSDLFSREEDEDELNNSGNSSRSSSKRQSTLNAIVTEGNASKIIEYYQREYDSSFGSVTKTFFSIWERVLDENEDSHGFIQASEDELLYELRRRVHNRIRKINQKRELSNRFWFPVDWLCFLAFGLNDDDQEWLKHNRISRLKDLAGGAKLSRQTTSSLIFIPSPEPTASALSRSRTGPCRRASSANPPKPPSVSNQNQWRTETFGLPQSLGNFPAAFPFVSFEPDSDTHSQFLSSASLLERKRKSLIAATSSASSSSSSSSSSTVNGIPSFDSLLSSVATPGFSHFSPPQLFGNSVNPLLSSMFPASMFPQAPTMNLGSFGSQNYYTNPLSPDSSLPIINGIHPLQSTTTSLSTASSSLAPSSSIYPQQTQRNVTAFPSALPQSLRITTPMNQSNGQPYQSQMLDSSLLSSNANRTSTSAIKKDNEGNPSATNLPATDTPFLYGTQFYNHSGSRTQQQLQLQQQHQQQPFAKNNQSVTSTALPSCFSTMTNSNHSYPSIYNSNHSSSVQKPFTVLPTQFSTTTSSATGVVTSSNMTAPWLSSVSSTETPAVQNNYGNNTNSSCSPGDDSPATVRIHIFPTINYPNNHLSRILTKKTFRLWQRLCVAYTIIEYFRFKQLQAATSSLVTKENFNFDKSEYLSKSYRYYAKKLLERYSNDIPVGLTSDLLCQHGLTPSLVSASSTTSLSGQVSTYLTGAQIYRIWTDITPKINQSYTMAWNEILKMFPKDDFYVSSRFNVIYSRFRKKLWEIQNESSGMIGETHDDDAGETAVGPVKVSFCGRMLSFVFIFSNSVSL
jgi:hypothetical protein